MGLGLIEKLLGAFFFLPHNKGNKPPEHHEAESLKRRDR